MATGAEKPSAEAAWQVANALVEERGGFDPPIPTVFVGEYCEIVGGDKWDAAAAAYLAADAGSLGVDWYDGRVRLTPSLSSRPDRGAVLSPSWGSHPWNPENDDRGAPALARALLGAHERSGALPSAEAFADCAMFWDALETMDRFGVDTTEPHGRLVCRECGEKPGWGNGDHLEEAHDGVEEYRRDHPAAPVAPSEASAMPSAEMRWR